MASRTMQWAPVGVLTLVGWGISMADFLPGWSAFIPLGIAGLWLTAAVIVSVKREWQFGPSGARRLLGRLHKREAPKELYDHLEESPRLLLQADKLLGDLQRQLVRPTTTFYIQAQKIHKADASRSVRQTRKALRQAGKALVKDVVFLEPSMAKLLEIAKQHHEGVVYIARHQNGPLAKQFTQQDITDAQAISDATGKQITVLDMMLDALQTLTEQHLQPDFTTAGASFSGVLTINKKALETKGDAARTAISTLQSTN